MASKHFLGLDIGTNSIGWSVISTKADENGNEQPDSINSAGVRIIPMDASVLGDFEKGNSKSQTADRTKYRSARRLYERYKLRRERLHRILRLMGFLPAHYAERLDRYGKFVGEAEPKLPWTVDSQGKPKFLFQDSFDEMLADFMESQPAMLAEGHKVPYDWTLYYLRKKALTQRIGKEELAWILLNFNQKRGYHQLRGEEEDAGPAKTRQYFASQTVVDIIDTGNDYKGMHVLIVTLADGTRGKIFKKEIPSWIGQKKDIIVTVDIDKDGNDRYDENGELSCRFKIPTEQEWEEKWKLIKAKTENDLDCSGKTVGEYIYDALLQTPSQKIRGKLVRTIERKYYKEELCRILDKQKEFHAELSDRLLYGLCVNELYPQNEAHRHLVSGRGLAWLLVEDVLFYQRPLKSKKSLIANCPYEEHVVTDKETGEEKRVGIKSIPKSHPLFQEFRLWQFISNLRIYQKEKVVGGKVCLDVDVTGDLLSAEDDRTALFDWLNGQKTIKQSDLLKCPVWGFKKDETGNYRWNYVEDKPYPANETRGLLLEWLGKAGIDHDFLTPEREFALWHILYSVSFEDELRKALGKFAEKNGLDSKFVETFVRIPPFDKDYGAYSCKAIKRLLPLMRMGKYWKEDEIDRDTRERIDKIVAGECDDTIKMRVREKAIHLTDVSAFRGLPLWLACYVVYNRHSEAKNAGRWTSPDDIDNYLNDFKQHSLHNPIVEQVILETLRTVRDIWRNVGHIDEIHVELGRDMKNPKDKRAQLTRQIQENENANLRVKALLTEFLNPEFDIANVRPYSPSQQELLRIYEKDVLDNADEIPDNISAILKKFNESDIKKRPTTSEVMRYKLWLEQKCRSPYTGRVISLSKLFTPAYEIEHVIPQARYFDDSLSNKVICESEVNKLKGSMLGYEFICKHHGEKVQLSGGDSVEILSVDSYEDLVKTAYTHNKPKMRKLLMDDIPEQFIARQLNDSRYISKFIKSLLSNIVREEGEEEGTSKNLVVCTGGVTDRLKRDWGINDVWNRIILPRFQRLNELTGSLRFTTGNGSGQQIPCMPLELQKGFNKKRIDHRHHAMDAIVIACASRNIVNYLNNESASKNAKISRFDLQRLLCEKKRTDDKGNSRWYIKKPWATFTQDTYSVLKEIIVSFKQNLRIINKTTNHYQHYVGGKKIADTQKGGSSWAIRKPMHKETVFGEVNLRSIRTARLADVLKAPNIVVDKELKRKLKELLALRLSEKQVKAYFGEHKDVWPDVDLKKIKVYVFSKETNERYFATRYGKDLVSVFSDCKTSEKAKGKIEKITDTGIRKILLRHLEANGNDPVLAFSPEGIEMMNKSIVGLNGGKHHCPIYKVRLYEKADKFAIGKQGNRKTKFVEAAKGTNLFFAVYETEQVDSATGEVVRKRNYATVPLNVVMERLKEGLSPAPDDENGNKPKFVLSPNDLVYLPTKEEFAAGKVSCPIDRGRVYKMVSCTENEVYFVPFCIANPIIQTIELGSNNKAQKSWTGEMIKETCLPLRTDRLGNITVML